MRRESLELGPVPFEESCCQVGDHNYSQEGMTECSKYRDMLKAKFPEWPMYGCAFVVKCFPHDFGRYFEVCVTYDRADPKGEAFAFFVDENLPGTWNDTEKKFFHPDN